MYFNAATIHPTFVSSEWATKVETCPTFIVVPSSVQNHASYTGSHVDTPAAVGSPLSSAYVYCEVRSAVERKPPQAPTAKSYAVNLMLCALQPMWYSVRQRVTAQRYLSTPSGPPLLSPPVSERFCTPALDTDRPRAEPTDDPRTVEHSFSAVGGVLKGRPPGMRDSYVPHSLTSRRLPPLFLPPTPLRCVSSPSSQVVPVPR